MSPAELRVTDFVLQELVEGGLDLRVRCDLLAAGEQGRVHGLADAAHGHHLPE